MDFRRRAFDQPDEVAGAQGRERGPDGSLEPLTDVTRGAVQLFVPPRLITAIETRAPGTSAADRSALQTIIERLRATALRGENGIEVGSSRIAGSSYVSRSPSKPHMPLDDASVNAVAGVAQRHPDDAEAIKRLVAENVGEAAAKAIERAAGGSTGPSTAEVAAARGAVERTAKEARGL